MSEREFEAYLNLLARTLKLSEAQRQRISGELRDHLEERLEELTDSGVDRDAAILQALDEFGDANVLAKDLTEPSRRLHRRRLMQTSFATLATAAVLATGFYLFLPAQSRTGQPMVPATQAQAQPDDHTAVASADESVHPFDQIITVDFNDSSLASVLEYFRSALGVNVFVQWDSLEVIDIEKDMPITMQLKDVRAEIALDLLSESLISVTSGEGMGFELRENVLVIGNAEQFNRPELVVQTYDCTSLIELSYTVRRDWDHSSRRGFSGEHNFGPETTLVNLIRDTLGESAWTHGESLAFHAGVVVIRQTPERHAQLNEVLEEVTLRLAERVMQIEAANHREAERHRSSGQDAVRFGADGFGGSVYGTTTAE